MDDLFAQRRGEPLADLFGSSGGIDRPIRTEDLLIRHASHGAPKIWVPKDLMIPGPDLEYVVGDEDSPFFAETGALPEGARILLPGPDVPHPHAGKQWFYSRPSGWGDATEDMTNLHRWETRTVVEGFLEMGAQSTVLRLEWSGLDREDRKKYKDGANALCDRAKGLVTTADREGTAFHAITERHDHGMTVKCPPEYERHLKEWIRLTRHLKIANLYGEPAIETFVVNDEISCAGTFDRLVRYKPCPICGGRYYILDLKSGKVLFGQSTIGVQLGIYANSQKYDVVPNGHAGGAYPGLRRPMPEDICKCRGIVINIPIEQVREGDSGTFKWVNIREGWNAAKGIARDVRDFRSSKIVWMVDEEPEPDLLGMIEDAPDRDAITAIWRQYKPYWERDEESRALYSKAATVRLETLAEGAVI